MEGLDFVSKFTLRLKFKLVSVFATTLSLALMSANTVITLTLEYKYLVLFNYPRDLASRWFKTTFLLILDVSQV